MTVERRPHRRSRAVVLTFALLACAPVAASAHRQKPNPSSAGGGGRRLLQSTPAAAEVTGVAAVVDGRDVVLPAALATCDAGVPECDNRKFLKNLEKHRQRVLDSSSSAPEGIAPPPPPACANYDGRFEEPGRLSWVLGLAAGFGALMTYGIGANDAANSWGTSVGSGAVSVTAAVLLGGVCEWLGAVGLGYGVSKTIKGTSKTDDARCWACGYCDSEMSLYMVAMCASLAAAAVFLMLVTFTAMPVSTTHSIVGGTVGAAAVGVGFGCLNWDWNSGGLSAIIASWVISPVFSGIIGVISYWLTHHTVVKPKLGGSPRRNAMIGQPILWSGQTFVIVFLILLKAQPTKGWTYREQAKIAGIAAAVVFALVATILNPIVHRSMPSVAAKRRREELEAEAHAPLDAKPLRRPTRFRSIHEGLYRFLVSATTGGSSTSSNDSGSPRCETANAAAAAAAATNTSQPTSVMGSISTAIGDIVVRDSDERSRTRAGFLASSARITEEEFAAGMSEEEVDATYAFKYLLVFTAALESFAHGANDTANATGPFSAVYLTYSQGLDDCRKPETPAWIMAVAGFGVFLGVATMGHRVIRTIGKELTDINYQRGFCIEFASTLTVVLATVLEMPVSTTHCQVGAVVFVGAAAFGPGSVRWGLFGRIVLTWVLTLPIAGLTAAAVTAALRPAIVA